MAWDYEEKYQNKLWEGFHFFKQNGGNGLVSESIAPGKLWKLGEIRFYTTSVAFLSNQYITITISSVYGSAYAVRLLSYNFSGSNFYRWSMPYPLEFLSDDQLVIVLSNVSGVHIVGVEAIGWAVTG